MTTEMIMLVFKEDYADEFDTQGFAFLKLDNWEYIKKEIKDTEFPMEIGFGTNEYFEFDTPQEFIDAFKVTMVDQETISEIRRLCFMKPRDILFGICPYNGCEGCASDEFYEKEEEKLL